LNEEIGQDRQHIVRTEAALRHHREALPAELVDDVQHAVLPPVPGDVLDEVVAPDMAGPFRPQPDAGTVVEPEPASLRLFARNLETLPPPDPLDHRQADVPARVSKERMDASITVAAIQPRQFDDVRGQEPLVRIVLQAFALGRSVLAEHRTGPPLGYPEDLADLLDAVAATGGT